jgi:hypothetical protein
MKESFWGFGLILLGVVLLAFILFVQRMTKTNEEDFYIGNEILSASMVDAVDMGSYKSTGELVMSKEKFVEVFIRRFSETVSLGKTYKIDFYDIIEYPPKASVRIRTDTSYFVGDTNKTGKLDPTSPKIDTLLSGVLETVVDTSASKNASAGYYDLGYSNGKPVVFERSDFD